MIPPKPEKSPQKTLFEIELDDLIDSGHPLAEMAQRIGWESTIGHFETYFCAANGQPGLPIRLQVGLQLIKQMYGLSDVEVLHRWVENPYWQYLCGEQVFRRELPMDETTLLRFRKRIGEESARQLLKMSVELAKDTGVVSPESLKVLVADTTVMEKAVAYPTDSRLLSRCLVKLVEQAKCEGVQFRQTYVRSLPKLQRKIGGYAHARQYRRMRREVNAA